jgi:GlpG protein
MVCIAKVHINKKYIISEFCQNELNVYGAKFKIIEDGISISLFVESIHTEKIKEVFDSFYEQSVNTMVIEGDFIELKEEIKIQKHNLFTACCFSLFVFIYIMQVYRGEDFMNHLFYHKEFGLSMFLEPWKFITPALMHGSLLHLFMNLMCWNQLAGSLEKNYDYKIVLYVVLFSAFFSNLGQFIFSGPNFLGISGAIFGLIGYIWTKGKIDKEARVSFNNSVLWFSIGWIALGYLDIIPGMSFANEAHLFGLLSGIFYAVYEKKKAVKV